MRLCHASGVPFVARGSGTSLSGGSVPVEDGIVIALNRLNRILRLDPEERIAVVEPGVINLDVTRPRPPHGLYYAPDPSSQSICTIGGNVAFNSGGAHCLKYGMTTNHVLGLEVVLPDGEVVRARRRQLGERRPGSGRAVRRLGGPVRHRAGDHAAPAAASRGISHRCSPAIATCEAAGDAVNAVVAAGPAARRDGDHGRLAIEAAEAAVQPAIRAAPQRC